MKEARILVITPDPSNNISYYRANPLLEISDIHSCIDVTIDSSLWTIRDILESKISIVILTCPVHNWHLELMHQCKSNGIVFWVDYDDLIYDIPVWNRAWLEYCTPAKKQVTELSVKKFIHGADIVTVSTLELKNKFQNIRNDITVIENAFDDEFLPNSAPIGITKEVLYRGGESHTMDLWEYHRPIINAMKYSDHELHFLGMNPIFINMELNGKWTPQLSKQNYWTFLENNTARILIVPLKDCDFNRSKSNIAWIEGTYAGCAVLAPNWPEWQRPGIINYDNQVDFEGKLKGMMSGRIDLKSRVEKSRSYIMENLTLKKINEKRWTIIQKSLNIN